MRRFSSRNQGSHIPYGKSHDGRPMEGRARERPDWRDHPQNYDSHYNRRDRFESYYRSPRSLSMDRYNRYNGDRVSRYDLDDRPGRYDSRRPYARDGDRYGSRDDRRYEGSRGSRHYDRHENYEDKWMGGDARRYGNRPRGERERFQYPSRGRRYAARHGGYEDRGRDNARDDRPKGDRDLGMNLDNEAPPTDGARDCANERPKSE